MLIFILKTQLIWYHNISLSKIYISSNHMSQKFTTFYFTIYESQKNILQRNITNHRRVIVEKRWRCCKHNLIQPQSQTSLSSLPRNSLLRGAWLALSTPIFHNPLSHVVIQILYNRNPNWNHFLHHRLNALNLLLHQVITFFLYHNQFLQKLMMNVVLFHHRDDTILFFYLWFFISCRIAS